MSATFQNQNNNINNNNNENKSERPAFWIGIFCICLLLIVCLILLTTFLVIKPKLPMFRVNSATLTNLNTTHSSELNLNLVMALIVKNPNTKLMLTYKSPLKVTLSLSLKGTPTIAETRLAPFYQPRSNETSLLVELSVVGGYVGEDVMRSVREEMGNGSVRFRVNVFGLVEYETGNWDFWGNCFKVGCDDVRIGFDGNRSSLVRDGKGKLCEVRANESSTRGRLQNCT